MQCNGYLDSKITYRFEGTRLLYQLLMCCGLCCQRLQAEVDQWQKSVDALNAMAQKLVDEYSQDDTTKIKQNIDKINQRWTQLLSG